MTLTRRDASLANTAQALRAREVSPVDLAEFALSALGSIGPRYSAVAGLTPERALREAKTTEWRPTGATKGSFLRGIAVWREGPFPRTRCTGRAERATVDRIAGKTDGFSGAELAALRESGFHAIDELRSEHLVEALATVRAQRRLYP